MDLPADPRLHEVGTQFAKKWIEMFHAGDEQGVFKQLTHASEKGKFRFYSPLVNKPYESQAGFVPILLNVTKVLQGLYYVGCSIGTDKASNKAKVTLHFKATVTTKDGKKREADGIDIFEVDGDTGKATQLMVLVRPFAAAVGVKDGMGALLEAFKKRGGAKM